MTAPIPPEGASPDAGPALRGKVEFSLLTPVGEDLLGAMKAKFGKDFATIVTISHDIDTWYLRIDGIVDGAYVTRFSHKQSPSLQDCAETLLRWTKGLIIV